MEKLSSVLVQYKHMQQINGQSPKQVATVYKPWLSLAAFYESKDDYGSIVITGTDNKNYKAMQWFEDDLSDALQDSDFDMMEAVIAKARHLSEQLQEGFNLMYGSEIAEHTADTAGNVESFTYDNFKEYVETDIDDLIDKLGKVMEGDEFKIDHVIGDGTDDTLEIKFMRNLFVTIRTEPEYVQGDVDYFLKQAKDKEFADS